MSPTPFEIPAVAGTRLLVFTASGMQIANPWDGSNLVSSKWDTEAN